MANDQLTRLPAVLVMAATLACVPLYGQTSVASGEKDEEAKPLYLHWFKPFYRGNRTAPMHILTLRVTPSIDFEVHFRDPAARTRKCNIKGHIDQRDGQYVGSVTCIWKSGTGYDGVFNLDKPHTGRPLGFASAYHHTHVVLSHERSAEPFLKQPDEKDKNATLERWQRPFVRHWKVEDLAADAAKLTAQIDVIPTDIRWRELELGNGE